MTMIERVARAIYEADPAYDQSVDIDGRHTGPAFPIPWDAVAEFEGGAVGIYREMARAAIQAMREPNDEMMEAMFEAMFEGKYNGTQAPMIGAGFDAAIDAVLSETSEES